MPKLSSSSRFFVGALLFLVAASAGSSRWMGYSQSENDAATAWFSPSSDDSAPGAGARWLSHHGWLPPVARLPYAAAAALVRWVRPPADASRDLATEAIFSLAPQVETALLLLVVAVWIGRETGSTRRGNLWALAALLTTPLWPYAYIGMETLQALLVLLAAFLAIGPCRIRRGWRAPLLVLCAAVAVAAKSQGFLALPAVAFLLWRAGHREAEGPLLGKRGLAIGLAVVGAVRLSGSLAIARWFAVNQPASAPFPGGAEGGAVVHSPFDVLVNGFSFLASPNKGLLWFAPLVLWGLWVALRPAPGSRDLARFTGLLAIPFIGALSCLVYWTDETWGPRYLHTLLAPAILVLALGRVHWNRWLMRLAVAVGLVINALGVSVHYGTLYKTASRVEDTTLGSFQFDPRWNHARFNARVLGLWLRPVDPGPEGAPKRLFSNPNTGWMVGLPPAAQPKTVDLGELARPQPVALRLLSGDELPGLRRVAFGLLGVGLIGCALLVSATRRQPLDDGPTEAG